MHKAGPAHQNHGVYVVGGYAGNGQRLGGGGVQARCLECGGLGPVAARSEDASLLGLVLAKLGL